MKTRKVCRIDGCNRLGRNRGRSMGKTVYDSLCEKHHRMRGSSEWHRESIDNSKCEVCGWDKTSCDRHRIDNKKGYYKENVIVLCPNCHRLVTYNLIELKPIHGGGGKSASSLLVE